VVKFVLHILKAGNTNVTSYLEHRFSGTFAKFRKATVIFVISVCPSVHQSFHPSVRMEQLGSHWTDFNEI